MGETEGREGEAWDDAYGVVVGALAATPVPPGLRQALAELGVSLHRYDVVRAAVQARVRVEVGRGEGLVKDMAEWPEVRAEKAAKDQLHAARRAVEAGARAWVEGYGKPEALDCPRVNGERCAKPGFHSADECVPAGSPP